MQIQAAEKTSLKHGHLREIRMALRDVLRSTRKDGWKGALVFLFLICFAIFPLVYYDSDFIYWVSEFPMGSAWQERIERLAAWIKKNGDMQLTVLPSVVVFATAGVLRRSRFLKRAAASLFICALMAGISVHVVKKCFGRPRPAVVQTGLAEDAGALIGPTVLSKWNSFPSGHSSSAACGLMFLVMIFPRLGYAMILIVSVIGLSRVISNAHWLTDVIGGVGHGCIWGWIGGKHLRRIRLRAERRNQRLQKASSTHEVSAADQP